MKPKTALQKQVVELSSQLPKVTEKQQKWAIEKSNDNYAVRSRNSIFCLECGHSWKAETKQEKTAEKCTCKSCRKKLIFRDNATYMREMNYFAIVTTKEEFQVVRMFAVYKSMKKNEKSSSFVTEVIQHWIQSNGQVTSMSKAVQGMSRYYDLWIFSSELEIRPSIYNSPRFKIAPYKVYPQKKVIPILKRNGFDGNFYDIAPHRLFTLLLTDSSAETLIKSGQGSVLSYYFYENYEKLKKVWHIVKICIRNNYQIKDAST